MQEIDKNNHSCEIKSKARSILIVGIVFFLISLTLSILVIGLDKRNLMVLNIIIKAILSIFSAILAYEHAQRLNRIKGLWAFWGILVGGIALIIVSLLKKKSELIKTEQKSSNKNTLKICLSILSVIVVSVPIIYFVDQYRHEQISNKSYQGYIDRRVDYLKDPINGDIFILSCEDNSKLESLIVDFNEHSLLLKTPKYYGRDDYYELYKGVRENYNLNDYRFRKNYDLNDSFYTEVWLKKENLLGAIEKYPSQSGTFKGVAFEGITGTKVKCRYDRVE